MLGSRSGEWSYAEDPGMWCPAGMYADPPSVLPWMAAIVGPADI